MSVLDSTGVLTGSEYVTARAWVRFNNAGTRASSYNVSSVTSIVTNRDYTITFASAMPNANYCVLGTGSAVLGSYNRDIHVLGNTAPTTSNVSVTIGDSAFSTPYLNVAVFSAS
jgi:hypothetical protein